MSEALYSLCTESPTEKSTPFSGDTILSNYASENITETINNNNLISSINSMLTFQNKLKQRNSKNTKELPNEILLKIFNNLDDLKDNLNLRCVNKKFKLLSEVKLYGIIEEKIQSLESKKKSLERRLSHMKNHLCPRLSHYKVFLNVISRSDVSELCNLPQPPREVKYIFSVLYILYTGGKNCYCLQCLQNRNTNTLLSPNNNSHSRSNSISGSSCVMDTNGKDSLTSPSRPSVNVSDLSSFNGSSNNTSRSNSNISSRRNSFDTSPNPMTYTRKRKGSAQSDIEVHNHNHPKKSLDHTPSPSPTSNTNTTIITISNTTSNTTSSSSSTTVFSSSPNTKTTTKCNTTIDTNYSTISKFREIEEEIEIPNWEEVRQVINKNDFRNWVMNLHSKLDTVPKEHILLANNLLNKPRTVTNSKATSNSSSAPSEYDNLRLTYDRMLIVSQIGYKILLFIEAIIQSFFLTERFEEQKNSISLVYKQIHQWKDLQLQCKN